MKTSRWSVLAAGVIAIASMQGAEERFSRAVPPADFSAAGLGKLSAEELARLDTLVRDFRSGALETAQREAAAVAKAAEARARDAEARAAHAEAEARAAASEARANATKTAKVTVAPGTEIEIEQVESRIVGEFRGWEGRTMFTLENGQRWQAAASDAYVTPPISNPAVKITPGMFGSYFMTIEGVKPRVKVIPVGAAR